MNMCLHTSVVSGMSKSEQPLICDDEEDASSHGHLVLLLRVVRQAGCALHADGGDQQTDATQEGGDDHESASALNFP